MIELRAPKWEGRFNRKGRLLQARLHDMECPSGRALMEMQLEPRLIKFHGRVMRVSRLEFNGPLSVIELVSPVLQQL